MQRKSQTDTAMKNKLYRAIVSTEAKDMIENHIAFLLNVSLSAASGLLSPKVLQFCEDFFARQGTMRAHTRWYATEE